MKWKMKIKFTVIVLLILVLAGCSAEKLSNDNTTSNNTNRTNSTEENTIIEDTDTSSIDHILSPLKNLPINQFFEQSYFQIMLRSPEYITYLGLADEFQMRNDMLDDLSDEFKKETQLLEIGILNLLYDYDEDTLSNEDKTSYDIYEYYLLDQIGEHEFQYYNYLVDHMVWSYTYGITDLLTDAHPMESKENVEDFISRLSQVSDQIDQVIEGLENSEDAGVILPAHIIDYTVGSINQILGSQSNNSESIRTSGIGVYSNFLIRLDNVSGLSDQEIDDFQEQAEEQIKDSFIPGFLALKTFLSSQYNRSNDDLGVWKFPNGEEYYEYLVRHFTSTDLTIDEIHQLGLSEIERITSEFWEIFSELGYPLDEDFDTLVQRAFSEAGYYNMNLSSDREAYIEANENLIEFADDLITPYFNIKPERQVEIYAGDYGGFYSPGSADGSRPGQYHISISGGYRPIVNIPTVFYHEALPGHHFQISLAQEGDLLSFRKDVSFLGQIEGWALYAEYIAWELGAYEDDPYGNIGRLQLELLRSVRLVVDTGIHAYGWTRDEAIEFLVESMGNDNWVHEVDRYAIYPGQALAYKVGQLKILELRNLSESELDDKFDIRDFHDIIIENGNVPLDILEEMVLDYIEETKGN